MVWVEQAPQKRSAGPIVRRGLCTARQRGSLGQTTKGRTGVAAVCGRWLTRSFEYFVGDEYLGADPVPPGTLLATPTPHRQK